MPHGEEQSGTIHWEIEHTGTKKRFLLGHNLYLDDL